MHRSPRWILIGTILGSGAVFIEGSVTLVALPAIARDFHLGIAGLQWVLNGYLLTLSSLILFGGALGDHYSRRGVFGIGLAGFAAASIACALAPNLVFLIGARVLQGAAGALVVPNSLALLETSFDGPERGAAVGHWAAWSAVSTAFGPLVGGWLVDAWSWRWVFVCIAPFAAAAVVAVGAASASERATAIRPSVDYLGAALVTLGLAGVVVSLIAGPQSGFDQPIALGAGVGGLASLLAFVAVERRSRAPLLPLDVFRNRVFVGVNATTLVVYAALNGLFFLLMLQLQNVLGFDALRAGASLLPINVIMLALSPIAGRVAARTPAGPRMLMTGGAIVAAVGMALFTRVQPGVRYASSVLPAAVVFGIGLAAFVAPLTSVALAALGERRAGLASGMNNAVARLAGLLAVAVLPWAAGLGGGQELQAALRGGGFSRAMIICAALCAAGALIAALTIRGAARPRSGTR